ncbi:MAG: (Fe-S)-binding protein [Methylotenera sp.]|nr:(Fe-S)-binding protein [Methylotenera sp.]
MSTTIQDLIVEAERCVACGLCLPHCPTYRKTGSEADSPRGRIQLMRAVAQDLLPNNDRFKQHIDLCLSCRSCETACPNSVAYGRLVDSTRALFIPKKNFVLSLAKPFIRCRALMNGLVRLLKLTQPWLRHTVPAAKLLPPLSTPLHWQTLYPSTAAKQQGEVSLFLGCASQALDSQTLQAAIHALNGLGYAVHIPAQQSCCGSIARQMGDGAEASALLAKNRNSFASAWPILTVASGCGAGLADYLPSHSVKDISAFLAECDWSQVSLKPLAQRIVVQDPCTLRNGQKSHAAVYSLLKKIPQAEVVALSGNGQCCGGAGAYMLTQPAMATQLLNDKLQAIKARDVQLLATSNIGCSLHIARGLAEQNIAVQIKHPVQIIAQQMARAAK